MKRLRRGLGPTSAAGLATSVLLGTVAASPAAGQSNDQMRDAYDRSGYTYCDATLLAAAWRISPWDAKAAIGGKILARWSPAEIDDALAPGRRKRQCSFNEEGYSYDDARALGRFWGIDPFEAKTKVERMLTAGRRRDVSQIIAEVRQ